MSEAQSIQDIQVQFRDNILARTDIVDPMMGESHKYGERLREAIKEGGRNRLIVSMNDLRAYMGGYISDLMARPRLFMIAMQRAAIEYAKELDPTAADKAPQLETLQIGFEDSLGENTVSPRGLTSALLKNLVVVEGIVTKCANVKPRLVKSVHYNTGTLSYVTRPHRDNLSLDVGLDLGDGEGDSKVRMPTPDVLPTKDKDGNKLETEFGLSTFKDQQMVVLQEMPERAQVGQLPRSVEVVLENDLVNRVKPGDRVQCVGIYRPLPGDLNVATFPTRLVGNNISILGKEIGGVKLVGEDIGNIRAMAEREDVLDIMGRSLCPTIFGHQHIKKALVLQLLGGCERTLANKTHLRGDINVLIIGDPSTAKSQLLRSVMEIAPLAISTTGRGSSGVGLTAAVGSDAESGERVLEAGAMVLADRGVVCIDEFDKMGESDRVAIHEVMEQQTVTIAKAGIHATLNARCSVIAAANPVYGQYDKARRPQENIGLPDSLLSRFDLLFIVLDQLDPALDRHLSEHVIRSHQYRRPGTTMEPEPLNQLSSLNLDESSARAGRTGAVWQQGRGGGAGNSSSRLTEASADGGDASQTLTKEFMRKYIHFAKERSEKPALSETAMAIISETYATMRSKQSDRTLPVTARSLETLIRLSSAHAKLRLSPTVDEVDVECAKGLVNFVLYSEGGDEGETLAAQQAAAVGQAHAGVVGMPTRRSRDEEGGTSGEGSPASDGVCEGEAPRKQSRVDDGGHNIMTDFSQASMGSQSQSQPVGDMDTTGIHVDTAGSLHAAVQRAVLRASEDDVETGCVSVDIILGMMDVPTNKMQLVAHLRKLESDNRLLLDGESIMFV